MGQATQRQSLPRPTEAPSEEDALRADVYRLLAALLGAPPAESDLARLATLTGNDSDLGRAVAALAAAARTADAARVAEEYHDLFIGLGRGELLPYASYYLTGFLHEKPLARLRQDMARFGIERSPDVSEPEDHAASILEIMAGLIEGTFGTIDRAEQDDFFRRHVASWMPPFFADLAKARAARAYVAVAGVGSAFLAVEEAALGMT